uniref:SfiI-subtelomeric related protein family member n=1 Tax=Theileria annulata TaxID=5874 RepID=A0A3B0MKC1_THEAN
MKRWIISLSVLYYITFLNQWNFVESQSPSGGSTTPDSDGSSPASTNPNPVTTTVTLVTLNISKTSSTTEFDYSKDGDFRTYTPKDDHVFTKIIKKPLIGSTKVIWTAKPDDQALKVVLMGSGKDEKFLSILLQSGNFVLLRKPGKNKPWEDVTSKRRDVTKLKFHGDNDVELAKTDYDVTLQDLSYTYIFNTGVKCVKITYNNETMWSHTDDPKFGYLKGLYLDLPKDQFLVTNTSDQTKQLTKAAEPTKVTLDINKSKDTDQFNFKKDGNFRTYTPKPGNVFEKIVKKELFVITKVLWESKDDVYGTLVSIKLKEGVSPTLAILLTDNSFKLFNDYAGTWKDITSQRHDLSKLIFLGENDTEVTTSDYTLTIVDLSFTYIFNAGVKCKKVKLADAEVWKHTDDSNFSDIKSLQLDLPTNKFFVTNSTDQTKELTLSQPVKTASQPASPSGGTTQPPRATGTTTPPSGTPTGGSTPSGTTPGTPSSGTDTPASETPTTP